VFQGLYDRVLIWSRHRHARRYLAGLSAAESVFFPIPPDVMLAPMVLAERNRAWSLALVTTVASVVGGVVGYLVAGLVWAGGDKMKDGRRPWVDAIGWSVIVLILVAGLIYWMR